MSIARRVIIITNKTNLNFMIGSVTRKANTYQSTYNDVAHWSNPVHRLNQAPSTGPDGAVPEPSASYLEEMC